MSDHDFETDLFALYGEPSASSDDSGVAERIVRTIERQQRTRLLLTGIAIVGGGGAIATALVRSLFDAAATAASSAPPIALTASILVGAITLAVVATRLALDA